MTIVLFLIILGALVLVHELGHFIVAKKAGIRVDEFAIGFPPRLYSKTIGETKYTLNLIPFGGYVKIFGEDDADELSPSVKGESRTDSVGIVSPIAEDASTNRAYRFTSKSKWTQALVLISGVLGNLVFAWLLLSTAFFIGIPSSSEGRYAEEVRDVKLMITEVLRDSPAERAGLKAGDEIISLEERERHFEEKDGEKAGLFIAHSEEAINISYERGGVRKTAEVALSEDIVPGKPAIGVMLNSVGVVRFGFLRSLFEGMLMTADLVREVAVGLADFIADTFQGDANLEAVTGPIGIVGLVGEARVLGLVYLLSFTAFISINLAVINLLPIPALDGGRLLFLAIEGITRRSIPLKLARLLNIMGFVALILFMVFITYRDIVKLF